MPLTTEISLHFYFPFKTFLKNERERERESARARERRSVGRRDRAVDRDLAVAIDDERGRSEIAIDGQRDRAVDRDLAFARSRHQSRSREEGEIVIALSIAIAPSIAIACRR